MKVRIIAVGKIKEREIRTLLDDYYGRIGRAAKLQEVELKDTNDPRQMAQVFEKKLLGDREHVVALDADGATVTSQGLSELVDRCQIHGKQSLAFLIGGAYGLPDLIKQRADDVVSLSRLTFPHRLCRLVLAEQVYRAYSILRNEPYDH